jgi:5'-phosphate synthase pdxT subunit
MNPAFDRLFVQSAMATVNPIRQKINESDKLVGLLAYQGAYHAHGMVCETLGYRAIEVRSREDLLKCSCLILPGGESTTFLKLLEFHNLTDSLKAHASSGKPILATCAGMIFLAREVLSPPQESMGILDIAVERNAYGSQVDSFETELQIPVIGGEPFHGVFIRAPMIRSVGAGVKTLATHESRPVFVQQGNIFATTFQPELSGDVRIHRMFLEAS